jgi:hypothetical protein
VVKAWFFGDKAIQEVAKMNANYYQQKFANSTLWFVEDLHDLMFELTNVRQAKALICYLQEIQHRMGLTYQDRCFCESRIISIRAYIHRVTKLQKEDLPF